MTDLEKIVEKFWEINLSDFRKIYLNLDFDKIENLDGWGRQSALNLKNSIDLKKYFFRKVYIFIGIRHIGLENAKLISKYLKSLSNFLSL